MSIVQNTFDVNLINAESREIATLFVNMFISFSYPLNFVIYCCMSNQFRSQFSVTFCRQPQQPKPPAGTLTSSCRGMNNRDPDPRVYELVGVSFATTGVNKSRDQV